ncbi:MAG: tetratricopeptide repeat protein [Desulfobacula sp.]|jgi:cytochrome c-type biogenesis protein CcmH/NrfG|nr:tetratricopeptide repeat protein [Desulfobacula sp.]MBT7261682.1 tetratricopeptide repeat protein [Desulfobacula sp.]
MPKNTEIENTETKNTGFVKKQTLVIGIIVSLFIGFVGGTIYSSFKLTADKQVGQQSIAVPNNNPAAGQQDNSVEVSAKILQVEQYLEQNPNDANAWTQLGNLFFDSDQEKNAIDAYEKSLTIEPGKIGVITDLGVMYRRNGQPEKAIEAFDKAIAIDPSFETARFNKGIVLLHDLNDTTGGIRAWEEIVKLNPMAMAPNGESVDALVQRMKKQK